MAKPNTQREELSVVQPLVVHRVFLQSAINCMGKSAITELSDEKFPGCTIEPRHSEQMLYITWNEKTEAIPYTNVKVVRYWK